MDALACGPLPKLNRFALQADHHFQIHGLDVWIPTGFSWDGASIPQALWSELGGRFEPESLRASLRHDWFYLFHGVDRATADRHFYECCREDGMSTLKAEAMYEALRAFGESHWPTSEADKKDIAAIREMISIRPDKDKFLATMKEG